MLTAFFQRIKYRMMAAQLRRPHGKRGLQTALMMNKANEFLYDYIHKLIRSSANQSILEIGFGNGIFFSRLLDLAPDIRVTGIDFSTEMVAAAKNNNADAIRKGHLKLMLGSSDQLPFEDASFDYIYCINVIYFWKDPVAHLKEIARTLKPGGKFFAVVRTKESMERMPFTKYGFAIYDKATWEELLTAAGLKLITEQPIEEPPVNFQGNNIAIKSLCWIATLPDPIS